MRDRHLHLDGSSNLLLTCECWQFRQYSRCDFSDPLRSGYHHDRNWSDELFDNTNYHLQPANFGHHGRIAHQTNGVRRSIGQLDYLRIPDGKGVHHDWH